MPLLSTVLRSQKILYTNFYYLSKEFTSILIPGPIVVVIEMFLTYVPLTTDGFDLIITSTNVLRFSMLLSH